MSLSGPPLPAGKLRFFYEIRIRPILVARLRIQNGERMVWR